MKTIARAIGLCLLTILLNACSPSSENTGIAEPVPTPVRVMEIQPTQLPLVAEVIGRLAPNREVTLAAEVGGVVAGYAADTGDRVEKDKVLVSLDPSDYRLALKEAEASFTVARTRLDLALKAYNRSKSLLPRKVITQDAYDRAESEYLSAAASLERVTVLVDVAKAQLAKTRIHAPFDGHAAARMIETGQMVGAGQPLMKIIDSDPMRVRIWLSEKEYVRLDKKDPVLIVMENFPEAVITGSIDRIDIAADERTNTFGVEILLDNSNLALKAGMTARVRITTAVIPDAILIPQSTVLYRMDRQEVFIAGSDNRAILRQIKLGVSSDEKIEVREGLSAGDQLIVTGGQFLKPGDKIVISAFAPAEAK
jgi:RND family efflux transporter MFP subunit